MADLKLTKIVKSYGDVEVLHGIDLEIESGEFVVFVGPSGCGKSTLLRTIAGLERITAGTMEIDGRVVNNIPPSERGIAMVFQTYALYPHMTVYDNMAFGMRLAKKSKQEIEDRVRNAADILQLGPYLDRLPKALSGGQRQRVAIGRAICRDPKVFLFDEPLSNLDAALRVATRIEIAKLNETMPDTTMIYVTHDQVEAMTLADKIVVLDFGVIKQVGTPRDLYEKPDNLFVAQFIGSPKMNVFDCETDGNLYHLDGHGTGPFEREAGRSAVKMGVRPEHIQVVGAAEGTVTGRVEVTEYLGADTFLYVDCGALGQIVVRTTGANNDLRGKTVGLAFDPAHLHFFDENELAV